MKEENLIFIISQPRSGSTYLQNLLSNNKETNTCSEPWILLNFANQLKPELLQAKFDNKLAVNAYEDYLSKYPNFDFKENQKQFLLSLYKPMLDGFNFVIDKTPRYWEILEDIVNVFPKSKVIILKRNPIDVAKSMIITWKIPSIQKLNYFKRDLLYAPKQIQTFCTNHKNNPNIYTLRYEDLIKETAKETRKVYEWIGIDYNDSVIETSKNQKYKGKFGDPYQNSKDGYIVVKKESKSLSKIFNEFLIGYGHFFGKEFLDEYGHYNTEKKASRETLPFKYFLFLGEYDTKENNFKTKVIWQIKKYLFELRFPK